MYAARGRSNLPGPAHAGGRTCPGLRTRALEPARACARGAVDAAASSRGLLAADALRVIGSSRLDRLAADAARCSLASLPLAGLCLPVQQQLGLKATDKADEQVASMVDLRADVAAVGMGDSFPYMFMYLYYEQCVWESDLI